MNQSPSENTKKGILKNKNKTTKKKGIRWDEENIQKYEEEKEPRMIIDEPKTPYIHYISDSYDSSSDTGFNFDLDSNPTNTDHRCSLETLSLSSIDNTHYPKAEELALAVNTALQRRGLDFSEEDSPNLLASLNEKKQQDFTNRRKAHYNEFHIVKQLREKKSKTNSTNQSNTNNSFNLNPPFNEEDGNIADNDD